MEAVAINCPKCGAPISDAKDISLVLCVYCGSRISIQETRDGKLRISLGEAAADLMTEQAFLRTLESQLVRLNGEKHQFTRERDMIQANQEKSKSKKEAPASNIHMGSCSIVMVIALAGGLIAWRSFDSFFALIIVLVLGLVLASAVGTFVGEMKHPQPAPAPEEPQVSPERERLQTLLQQEAELAQKINLVHKNINETKRNINALSDSLARRKN
jgi:DNA-directed RNA polymerase subunit RPC12/RpoP